MSFEVVAYSEIKLKAIHKSYSYLLTLKENIRILNEPHVYLRYP